MAGGVEPDPQAAGSRHRAEGTGGPARGAGPGRRAWAAALFAYAVLLGATALHWNDADLADLPLSRRYWEDLTVAASSMHAGTPAILDIGSNEGLERRRALQNTLVRAARVDRIRPWQFWRGVPLRPYLRGEVLKTRPTEDAGRARALGFVFRGTGRVLPFLPLWFGALAALPVFAFVVFEFGRAGRSLAGGVLLLLCAVSPFFVEALSLPYSGVGLFVLAILALCGLGTYASGPGVTPRGVLGRAALYGVFLALAAGFRGSVSLLAPGYLVAVAVAGWRAGGSWRTPCAGVVVVLLTLATLRENTRHDAWITLWEGLGDFDRTHGHEWNDRAVRAIAAAEGIHLPPGAAIFERGPEIEALMRPRFLASVQQDPAWYAGILVRRALATVTLWKLWPWGPTAGASMRPASTPNEGTMDTYWRMTTTADFVGVGEWKVELPVLVIAAPVVALGVLVLRRRAPPGLLIGPACVAVAALGLPVAVTTASGIETEAFVIVHFMAAALLADHAVPRQRTTGAAPAG